MESRARPSCTIHCKDHSGINSMQAIECFPMSAAVCSNVRSASKVCVLRTTMSTVLQDFCKLPYLQTELPSTPKRSAPYPDSAYDLSCRFKSGWSSYWRFHFFVDLANTMAARINAAAVSLRFRDCGGVSTCGGGSICGGESDCDGG